MRSVAPARERGLKFSSSEDAYRKDSVAPARERGLKSSDGVPLKKNLPGRSRKGAWIEMLIGYQLFIAR